MPGGHGDLKERLAPQKIETLKGVRQVSAGGHHSLALLENGEVYAFGYNSNGQRGDQGYRHPVGAGKGGTAPRAGGSTGRGGL